MKLVHASAAAIVLAAGLTLSPAFAGGDGGSSSGVMMLPPEDPCALIDAARSSHSGRCSPGIADRGATTNNQPYGPRFSNRNRTPGGVQAPVGSPVSTAFPNGSSVTATHYRDGRMHYAFRYSDGATAEGFGRVRGVSAQGLKTWEIRTANGEIRRFHAAEDGSTTHGSSNDRGRRR